MPALLQQNLRTQDSNVRESKLRAAKVRNIIGDDYRRAASDCQFQDVIVAFIPQVRSPQIVDLHPFTDTEKCLKQLSPLGSRQR